MCSDERRALGEPEDVEAGSADRTRAPAADRAVRVRREDTWLSGDETTTRYAKKPPNGLPRALEPDRGCE
jgi:hypothetical protein